MKDYLKTRASRILLTLLIGMFSIWMASRSSLETTYTWVFQLVLGAGLLGAVYAIIEHWLGVMNRHQVPRPTRVLLMTIISTIGLFLFASGHLEINNILIGFEATMAIFCFVALGDTAMLTLDHAIELGYIRAPWKKEGTIDKIIHHFFEKDLVWDLGINFVILFFGFLLLNITPKGWQIVILILMAILWRIGKAIYQTTLKPKIRQSHVPAKNSGRKVGPRPPVPLGQRIYNIWQAHRRPSKKGKAYKR